MLHISRRDFLTHVAAGIGTGLVSASCGSRTPSSPGNSLPGSEPGSSLGPDAKAPVRRVLWAANVRSKSLDDRLRIAQMGGFTHMSIFPIDFRNWTENQGMTAAQIRRRLADAGVRVLVVDPYTQWVPGFTLPEGYPPEYISFVDFNEEQILRIAAEVEAEAINCVEGLNQPHETAAFIDGYGDFADKAAGHGLRITLEFMPISQIPDLAAGMAVVQGAGRQNAGYTFDTWHFFRSNPDFALLKTVDGNKVFEVQLADGPKELQGQDLTEDLLRYRRLPGEGDFDLTATMAILNDIGAVHSVGPEVFADAMDAMSVDEVARRSATSLDSFL